MAYYPGKCCRSTPRCRDCPVRRPAGDPGAALTIPAELVALLTPKGGDVPEHLVGVPPCLHKYEPLFRRAADEREAAVAAGGAQPSPPPS